MVVEHQRQCRQRVALLLGDHVGFFHLLQYGVAAQAHPLVAAYGIVVRRVLDHAHQRGRFLDRQILGILAEVNPCRRLDAYGVVEEVELVEIHLYDLVLGVEPLEFDGDHPFDRFLQGTFEKTVAFRRVQLLGELLGDGRSAAGIFLSHEQGLDQHAGHGPHVDTRVILEAGVLGGDERVDHVLRDFVVVGIHAVACVAEVAAEFYAVGRVNDRCEFVSRVLKILDRRHVADHTVVDKCEKAEHGHSAGSESDPQPFDNLACARFHAAAGFIVVVHRKKGLCR